jgi:hypothetical protein
MKKITATLLVILFLSLSLMVILTGCHTPCPTLDTHLTVSLKPDQVLFTNTSSTPQRFVLFKQHAPFQVPVVYFMLDDFTLRAGESVIKRYSTTLIPLPCDQHIDAGDVSINIATANPSTLPQTGVIPNSAFTNFEVINLGHTCQFNGLTVSTF